MELLLALAIPALLVWAITYVRLAGIAGCMLAALLIGTVFGHPFFHVSVVTFDRLILGGCMSLFAAYQIRRWNQPIRWTNADFAFLFFIAAMLITTMIHPAQGGFTEPASKLLFFFLLPAMAYVIASQITLSPAQLRAAFAGFALLGIYLAATAVAEKMNWQWAIFPRYIASPKYEEFLGRGRGPLLNPAANGILLTLALACAAMIAMWYKQLRRATVLATLPIYLVGILCTLTRSVWLGCAAAIAGLLFTLLPRYLRIPAAMAALSVASLGTFVDVKELLSFKRDRNVSVEQMRESAQLRPILAMVAWKMFSDHPLLGCGTNQYMDHAKLYLSDRNTELQLQKARPYVQHNMFLAMLVENGLIALIPFCVLLFHWSLWSWELWKREHLAIEYRQLGLVSLCLLASYIINGMFHDVLIFPMINMYVFFIAGCVRNCKLHATSKVPSPAVHAHTWQASQKNFLPAT